MWQKNVGEGEPGREGRSWEGEEEYGQGMWVAALGEGRGGKHERLRGSRDQKKTFAESHLQSKLGGTGRVSAEHCGQCEIIPKQGR